MRYLTIGSALVAFTLYQPTPLPQAPQQAAQVCGQGVILRSSGAILIEGWSGYVPPTSPGQFNSTTDLPKEVFLARTLKDDVRVIVETANGVRYLTMKELRAIK